MTLEEKAAFAHLLIQTAEGYGKKLSNLALEDYWQKLRMHSLQSVGESLQFLKYRVSHEQFMPTPAAIVQNIEGNVELRALQAWNKVVNAIALIGAYETVVFDDRVIHRVIADWRGWIKLCSLDEKQLMFEKNTFITLYKGYVNRHVLHYPAKLIGLCEKNKSSFNKTIDSPVFFGNIEKAKIVFQQGNREEKNLLIHRHSKPILLDKKNNEK